MQKKRRFEACEILNLGNNQPELLMDITRYLGDALGIERETEMLMQSDDVSIPFVNIDRARLRLEYMPRTSLQQGLTKFVKWLEDDKLNDSSRMCVF